MNFHVPAELLKNKIKSFLGKICDTSQSSSRVNFNIIHNFISYIQPVILIALAECKQYLTWIF